MANAQAKEIQVEYYALLREERGLPRETMTTSAATAGQLYEELQAQYRFTLPGHRLKVAINNEFKDFETPLNPKDIVVFIPPVAGG